MKLQEVQDNLDRTGERMKNIETKFNKVTKGLGTLTSMAGSAYAAMNGLSNLTYSLGTSTASFGTVLGSLLSVLPLVTVGIRAMGEAIKTAEHSSIILTAIALGLSAITAIAGIFQGRAKAKYENNNKATTTTAEKFVEESTKANDELDESGKLIKNYNDLYETYLETGEGQDQLAESARALAEAYGLVGANVLIAQGNFEEFNKLLAQSLNFNKQINEIEQKNRNFINDTESGLGNSNKGSVYSLYQNDDYKNDRAHL